MNLDSAMVPLPELPRICVCIGHADQAEAGALAAAMCERGETFLELRIDLLAEPARGAAVVQRIRRAHPSATVLATCRRAPNGGRFRGTVADQISILRAAVAAGAELVDVEIETAEEEPASLDPFRGAAATVVSYHNFGETPALGPVLRRLRQTDAAVYKIATAVRRPHDNVRLLALCRDQANLVVLGMGETGAPTRLLGPSRGSLFTFAAADPGLTVPGRRTAELEAVPTAPGQLSAAAVRGLYQAHLCSPEAKVFAVVAQPVGHSKSPLIHNRAFQATGFPGVYVPLLVEPAHLEDLLRAVRELPLEGLSVTIPHKRSIVRLLDEVAPEVRGLDAVNTVYRRGAKLVGTNTDIDGIAKPLARRIELRGSRVLVVGNGGAAVAALYAAAREGAQVVVSGRNPQRVRSLAQRHGAAWADFAALEGESFDVLIHATPVGMLPDVEGTLFPGRIPAEIVFDLVYNPLETALLRHARKVGKTVISGMEMFVEQAAAQFRIWTGLAAPCEVMRRAVLQRTVR